VPVTSLVAIVDDDESVRESLPHLVRELGFAARAFASAEDFLASGTLDQTRCLHLDIAMPGLDGYSVCRLLKSDPELSTIPVILMTTGATVHHRLAGLTLGADDFLSKPIDMRELILRIRVRLGC